MPIVASIALVAGVLAVSPAAIQPSRAAAWGFIRLENILEANDLGISKPGALAYDAAAHALVVFDGLTGRATLVGTQGAIRASLPRREAPRRSPLAAYDAQSKHVYTLDPKAGVLVETDPSGIVVSRRNVTGLNLQGVAGMAVGPTADTTDAADATSLYVSAANASDGGSATGPGIVELALAAPTIAAALAGVPDNVGHQIKVINTTAPNWDPFSPDPSGIAYADSIGKFIVDDGEIEEESVNNYPYPGHNVWQVDPVSGAGDGILDTTRAAQPTRSRSEWPTTRGATSCTSRGTAAARPSGRTRGVDLRGCCGTCAS